MSKSQYKRELAQGRYPLDIIIELEAKLQQVEAESKQQQGFAYDNGLESARKGVQEVHTDPDAEVPEWREDLPFCRIRYYEDAGDPSVGIQGWAAWVVDENQKGTALAELLAQVTALSSALKKITGIDIGSGCDGQEDAHEMQRIAQAALNTVTSGDMVLVPREPTEEMLAAIDTPAKGDRYLTRSEAINTYKAMINVQGDKCPKCGGNDKEMACAYPSEGEEGCLRDKRLNVQGDTNE